MLAHTWVEQYRDLPAGSELAEAVRSAVHFDLGESQDMPSARVDDLMEAKPPFDSCLLQFSTPLSDQYSHVLILWCGQPDGSVHLMSAWKHPEGWRTTNPTLITPTTTGFQYEGVHLEGAERVVKRAHALALNAFCVLGCSNVRTVKHEAPPP